MSNQVLASSFLFSSIFSYLSMNSNFKKTAKLCKSFREKAAKIQAYLPERLSFFVVRGKKWIRNSETCFGTLRYLHSFSSEFLFVIEFKDDARNLETFIKMIDHQQF